MECTKFNIFRTTANLAYNFYRPDPFSIVNSGIDIAETSHDCLKKIFSNRNKNNHRKTADENKNIKLVKFFLNIKYLDHIVIL